MIPQSLISFKVDLYITINLSYSLLNSQILELSVFSMNFFRHGEVKRSEI